MTQQHDDRGFSRPEGASPLARAPYQKPELVEFGDVRELTRGNGGSMGDINGMPHK
jgi:hypothetical protein